MAGPSRRRGRREPYPGGPTGTRAAGLVGPQAVGRRQGQLQHDQHQPDQAADDGRRGQRQAPSAGAPPRSPPQQRQECGGEEQREGHGVAVAGAEERRDQQRTDRQERRRDQRPRVVQPVAEVVEPGGRLADDACGQKVRVRLGQPVHDHGHDHRDGGLEHGRVAGSGRQDAARDDDAVHRRRRAVDLGVGDDLVLALVHAAILAPGRPAAPAAGRHGRHG
jgi:hypothetical protein